ncbi:MAG: hypothetical protein EAZ89_13390 [Bacteroidetes bacterium]|nr:MAG: hypothetical protein EAZ89_13390 [Bacteroidota bacterium]
MRDFDLLLPADLVARGRALLAEGAVLEIVRTEDGDWQASVKGTDVYNVRIALTDREIRAHQCSCPFPGETCKHQVAVLFWLRRDSRLEAFPGE